MSDLLIVECFCGDQLRVARTEEGQAQWERWGQEHEMCNPDFDAESAQWMADRKLDIEPVDWIGGTGW